MIRVTVEINGVGKGIVINAHQIEAIVPDAKDKRRVYIYMASGQVHIALETFAEICALMGLDPLKPPRPDPSVPFKKG